MFFDPDKALSVFSSSGNLTQCDNASKAAYNSALSIGVASKEGCILASFKNVPPLVVKEEYYKVFQVCPTIGVTYSGLQPDFRAQLHIAQEICEDYFDVFEKYPSIDLFISEFCQTVQEYSQKHGLRPFGTILVFCGTGKNGTYQLYQVDPSGSFSVTKTSATGVGSDGARSFMEQRVEELDDNIANAVQALVEHSGCEVRPEDVSVGVLRGGKFIVYDPEGVREVFDSIRR